MDDMFDESIIPQAQPGFMFSRFETVKDSNGVEKRVAFFVSESDPKTGPFYWTELVTLDQAFGG